VQLVDNYFAHAKTHVNKKLKSDVKNKLTVQKRCFERKRLRKTVIYKIFEMYFNIFFVVVD